MSKRNKKKTRQNDEKDKDKKNSFTKWISRTWGNIFNKNKRKIEERPNRQMPFIKMKEHETVPIRNRNLDPTRSSRQMTDESKPVNISSVEVYETENYSTKDKHNSEENFPTHLPIVKTNFSQSGLKKQNLNKNESGFTKEYLNKNECGLKTENLNKNESGLKTENLNKNEPGLKKENLNKNESGLKKENLNKNEPGLKKENLNKNESGLKTENLNKNECGLKKENLNKNESGLKTENLNKNEPGLKKENLNKNESGLKTENLNKNEPGLKKENLNKNELGLKKENLNKNEPGLKKENLNKNECGLKTENLNKNESGFKKENLNKNEPIIQKTHKKKQEFEFDDLHNWVWLEDDDSSSNSDEETPSCVDSRSSDNFPQETYTEKIENTSQNTEIKPSENILELSDSKQNARTRQLLDSERNENVAVNYQVYNQWEHMRDNNKVFPIRERNVAISTIKRLKQANDVSNLDQNSFDQQTKYNEILSSNVSCHASNLADSLAEASSSKLTRPTNSVPSKREKIYKILHDLQNPTENVTINNGYNILVLGQSGVGKSTWINSVVNYLQYSNIENALECGVKVVIPTKFAICNDDYETVNITKNCDESDFDEVGESCTRVCDVYSLKYGEKIFNMIDTPGIGDTKGLEQDQRNLDLILNFLSKFENIHCVCILLKPNESRLESLFRFCITEILRQMHKSIQNNIVFCFTNSRGTFYRPGDTFSLLVQLLNEIKLDLELCKDLMYCMDNECYRYLCSVDVSNLTYTDNDKNIYNLSWEKSCMETKRLLDYVLTLEPHQVKHLSSLNNVRKRLTLLIRPLAEIEQNIIINLNMLEHHEYTLKMSKTNNIEELAFIPRLKNDIFRHEKPILVCQICKSKCLSPFYLKTSTLYTVDSLEIKHSSVMNTDGSCKICKCNWKCHIQKTFEVRPVPIHEKIVISQEKFLLDKQKLISLLQTEMKKLTKGKNRLLEACAIFELFLKVNSIVPFSSIVQNYFMEVIRMEELKVKEVNCDDRMLLAFNESLETYRMISMRAGELYADGNLSVSLEDINKYFEKVCRLSSIGSEVVAMYEASLYHLD